MKQTTKPKTAAKAPDAEAPKFLPSLKRLLTIGR